MNKNLEEISDGKRYGLNDMVRAACNDCAGCSSCCEDMGESIILDPLDIYELTKNLNTTFENLLKEQIELHVVAVSYTHLTLPTKRIMSVRF